MNNPTKSPLKWAGGKARALKVLTPHIAGQGRLIEPFVGAGSVFMAFPDRDAVINDANTDLISFYLALKHDLKDLLTLARPLFSDANRTNDAYTRLRTRFNTSSCSLERAALLLYLNRFGFNGLYRVNRKGTFNTPYGHLKKTPRFPNEEMLAMSNRLQQVTLMQAGDFSNALQLAGPGDVVYCDPPYVDTSPTEKSFTAYTSGSFTFADQRRLVAEAWQAAERGAKVVISNHDTAEARRLYAGMEVHSFEVRRSLAASANSRGVASELIAVLKK